MTFDLFYPGFILACQFIRPDLFTWASTALGGNMIWVGSGYTVFLTAIVIM